ncbi:MAG: hypothetical protein AAF789_00465 [Bacteroidota bacterium]
MKQLYFLILLFPLLFSCVKGEKTQSFTEEDSTAVESEFVEFNNPPAEGFNQEDSDLLATLLADKVMLAMGGREAWDQTEVIKWNFFGRRNLVWNKKSGDIRIDIPEQNLTILQNIYTKEGRVQKDNVEVSDSLDYYLDQGYYIWVNDSYWLCMPYKLKDSGVTLKYLREDTTQAGTPADVISLSFDEVGVTPQNIYEVWIDTDSKLVTQWAYYPDSTALKPRFINPWKDYKKYGEILLSGDRGQYAITDIEVLSAAEADVFSSF